MDTSDFSAPPRADERQPARRPRSEAPAHRPPPAPQARVALPPPAPHGRVGLPPPAGARAAPPPPAARSEAGSAYASWGIRLGAICIDGLIGLVLGLVLSVIVYGIGIGLVTRQDTIEEGFAVIFIGQLLISIAAFVFLAWQLCRRGNHNGQTFGKQALGIRVVRADGRPVNFGTVLMRHFVIGVIYIALVLLGTLLIDALAVVLFVLLFLANYLWPLWDERRQALHDKLAKTFVVRDSTVPVPAGARPPTLPAAGPLQRGEY